MTGKDIPLQKDMGKVCSSVIMRRVLCKLISFVMNRKNSTSEGSIAIQLPSEDRLSTTDSLVNDWLEKNLNKVELLINE